MGLAIDRIDLESEAQWLRRCLAARLVPATQLLCTLRFFESSIQTPISRLEPYLRAFIPSLARATTECDPSEFFPEDLEILSNIVELISTQSSDVVSVQDRTAIASFSDRLSMWLNEVVGSANESKPAQPSDDVTCLLVEQYPELGLPPRGRILEMKVESFRLSSRQKDDVATVKNPLYKPDDSFLVQARRSVSAARRHLKTAQGLSEKARFRIDYSLGASAGRFTGESLGVALAVSAIGVLSREEGLRNRLEISPQTAISGALNEDGTVTQIDGEGLRQKIRRAFFSHIKHLAIPKEHLDDAKMVLNQLEPQYPNRHLELIGVGNLEEVLANATLVRTVRIPTLRYRAGWIWQRRRSPLVQGATLLVLLSIFYLVVKPKVDPNPQYVVANVAASSMDVYNRDSVRLWSDTFPCPLNEYPLTRAAVADLDGDGRNEVAYIPPSNQDCPPRDSLYCKNFDGTLRFKKACAISNQYLGDTAGVQYDLEWVHSAAIGKKRIIVTEVAACSPIRSHIRLWDDQGKPLGWYINQGGSHLDMVEDFNGDGVPELYFLNFNNRVRRASLLVLSPDSVSGVSPPYLGTGIPGVDTVQRGNQLAYITFPVSDVCGQDGRFLFNQPGSYLAQSLEGNGVRRKNPGTLEVFIGECGPPYELIYELDAHFRVVSCKPTDPFVKRRDDFVKAGKLPAIPWDVYLDSMLCGVCYWTASGWVTEGSLRSSKK